MGEKKNSKESPRRMFLKTASLGAVAIGLAGLGGTPADEKPVPVEDPKNVQDQGGSLPVKNHKTIGRYIRLG